MPYIITTHCDAEPMGDQSGPHENWCETCPPVRVTRRAVATLDEAREQVRQALIDAGSHMQESRARAAAWAKATTPPDQLIPEHGGTVGPLPDGTVIEVRRVTLHELDALAPTRARDLGQNTAQQIIDAYNEANA